MRLARSHLTIALPQRGPRSRLALPLLVILTACHRRLPVDRLVVREGRAHVGTERRPFSGTAYDRHPGGALKQETPYRSGRKHGLERSWFENGRRKLECGYRDGRPAGACEEWYSDGTAKLAARYEGGELVGLFQSWHPDGSLRFTCLYRDGRANGPCQQWFGAGRPQWRATFSGGVLDGELALWHPDGRPRFLATVHGDTPTGTWQKWHPNGASRQRGAWREGRLDGVWEEWDEQGRRIERAEYHAGERVALRQWFENGRPRLHATLSGGTSRWRWRVWSRDGYEQHDAPLLRGLYPFLFARPPATGLGEAQRASLASRRRLPGRPLEEMRFVGDYGFTSYLVHGMPGRWLGLPGVQGEPPESEGSCSTVVTTNRAGEALFAYNHDFKRVPLMALFTAAPGAWASISVVTVPQMLDVDGNLELLAWSGDLVPLRAPYYPIVGMNERGVAVSGMGSDGQDPAFDPRRATLSYSQMIRLVLDFAGDVDEALELVGAYNWQHFHDHLMVADRSGRSIVIEFVDGDVVAVPATGRWQIATNFRLAGRTPAEWAGRCWRYDRAAAALAERQGDLDAEATLALLSSISMETPFQTSSSTVFNLTTGDVLLAAHRDYQNVSRFHLAPR